MTLKKILKFQLFLFEIARFFVLILSIYSCFITPFTDDYNPMFKKSQKMT
ncbi:hypothetical protein SPAR1_2297 [Streptococcus pneumoniae GA02254]|nr:hypothetical protein SPAR1_2297 [Streptococcus pneumoniae GA02254]